MKKSKTTRWPANCSPTWPTKEQGRSGIGGATAKPAEELGDTNQRHGGDEMPTGMHLDYPGRVAYWNGQRIPINSSGDFDILVELATADGIATHTDLFRRLKPEQTTQYVLRERAEPEVKENLTNIRRGLKAIECPLILKSVRSKGYRLFSPDT